MTRSLGRLAALVTSLLVGCSGGSGGGSGPGPQGPGPVSASTSSFTATATPLVANGADPATLTVVARDADGAAVPGKPVAFAAEGGGTSLSASTRTTDAAGTAWVTLVSTVAGATTVYASADGVDLPDRTVMFVAGPASPARSTLRAEPSSAAADGVSTVVLTATARDAFGNAVAGLALTFGATGATVSPGTVSTDADGVATTAATSLYGGNATVRAYAGAQELASAGVTFVADPSFQLAAARAAPDGDVALPVQGARVTT